MACYHFGPFALNSAARVLLRDNRQVDITAKIFETLLLLVKNHGRVLDKEELLATLWPNTTVEEANLTQSISTLRKVLNDTPKQHCYIATVPGRGYSFVAAVVETPTSEPSDTCGQVATPPAPPAKAQWHDKRFASYSLTAVISLMILAGWIASFRHRPVEGEHVFYAAVAFTNYLGRELSPSFSPDGEQVAFAWDGAGRDNFDIYVKPIRGGGLPLRLTDGPEPDISPAWSPDGRTIAFVHVLADHTAEVSLIAATGAGPRRVLTRVTMKGDWYYRFRFLCWSPDGKWLAVSDAPTAAGVSSLFFLSAETGEKRRGGDSSGGNLAAVIAQAAARGELPDILLQITFPPLDFDDLDPDFSSDMKSLAFARCTSIGASSSDLYIQRLSGDLRPVGAPRRLTALNRQSISPVWTPDGRAILFAKRESRGSHSLWRINATDPQQVEPLPIPADDSSTLALSRRGDKIVYTRDIEDFNIWSVELTDAKSRVKHVQPWITSTAREENPQFSPDGQYVAYQSDRSGKKEIWICRRDGSNNHQLTDMGAIVSGFPRWSPDGEKIVFHSRVAGSAGLYVVNAMGGVPRQLTSGEGNDVSPSWSHDGRWIYFGSRRSGEPHIWRMPSGGGPATQMTRHNGYSPMESKDGQYLYFTTLPEDALWKLPSAGGPEVQVLPEIAGNGVAYAEAKNGIYFIRAASHGTTEELAFFRFATGHSETVTPIPGSASLGFALSPDERMILYGQTDRRDSDLMLVEHFH